MKGYEMNRQFFVKIWPWLRQAELINFGIDGPLVLMRNGEFPFPPIVMEVENEVLEDVFSLQKGLFSTSMILRGSVVHVSTFGYKKSPKEPGELIMVVLKHFSSLRFFF